MNPPNTLPVALMLNSALLDEFDIAPADAAPFGVQVGRFAFEYGAVSLNDLEDIVSARRGSNAYEAPDTVVPALFAAVKDVVLPGLPLTVVTRSAAEAPAPTMIKSLPLSPLA